MQDLSVEKELLPGGTAVILRCRGDLDAHTFEALDQVIAEVLEQGIPRIVMDIAGVPYISSAGLGVFINSRTEAENSGGGVVLLNPSSQVGSLLEEMGLDSIFPIAHSQEEALEQLGVAG